MLTITIIEEKLLLRTGLKSVLSQAFPEAAFFCYYTPDEFLEALPPVTPGIIIYGINGRTRIKSALQYLSIKKHFHECRVMFLDEAPEAENIVEYLRQGLDGYILNTANENELRECIQNLVANKPYLSTEFFRLLSSQKVKLPAVPKSTKSLTAAELTVARYLSQGIKTTEVARTLKKAPSTISTMKMRIFWKLNIDNLLQLREALRSQAL